MKNIVTTFLFCFLYSTVTSQITSIPDSGFEQVLIDLEIDSDGIINGQVLTSDIENVTELIINPDNNAINVNNINGIEAFINLEKLTIIYSMITELDVSQNIRLKQLTCGNNYISDIDVSNNTLLEVLDVGNYIIDVGLHSYISEINLSANPNIQELYATHIPELKIINLKNGNNNPDMYINLDFDIMGPAPQEPVSTICIQIDNEELAQSNQFPYSEWTINDFLVDYNFSENCALSTSKFQKDNTITLYPNPATNILNLTCKETITEAAIYNLLGQKVKQLQAGSTTLTTDVSSLTAGTYFVVVKTGMGSSTEKLVVK